MKRRNYNPNKKIETKGAKKNKKTLKNKGVQPMI
jgi:hypothetical protein